ncbi:D-glycero-beta-D-manno-heptose 1-phosphate adenylyltransferase [Fusobacterium sp.]|uniref:D-glycero-beta-D-manno-heptose 1-phosphate adenylyltransferase n=1 Tax=Fusobacterium sp. TaxID=68766 RepID=UPI0029016D0A|nr:D-glycero-beta-D-manno-heptose 1-phosphate adenylyltransferase [Fusobacterium sp.]MDU1910813.1 D-glycero-beta-D-manno-heptose 1-phosphate adenylyltransferase [Fusobacterium sp.]
MILSKETAAKLIEELKLQGKKVVFTNGCFDILHVGHLRYLNEAKKQGDILIVAVNSDVSVKQLKGTNRPINNEIDRAEMLSGLKAVDFTVIFDELTPIETLDKLKPSIHVKGGDYDKNTLPETPTVEKHGGEVRILSFIEGKSTTNIVNKIQFKDGGENEENNEL